MIKTRLLKLVAHAKKYIIYNILWNFLSLISQIIAVFTVAGLLQDIIDRSIDKNKVIISVIILLAVITVRFICERMSANASYKASVDVKRILRNRIYEKMLRLGAGYKEKISTSEVVQISTEGVEQLETYFGKYLPQFFYSLLAPILLFVILSFISIKASVVLLICVPLIPISIVAVQKLAKRLLNKYWGIYTGLGDSFLENLQGLTTLKIYQADSQKAVEMDKESDNFRRVTMKVLTMQLNSTSVMDIVAYGGAAVGMVVAVSQFLNGNIDFSGTLIIVLLASEFFIPLRLLGSFFHIAMNGMTASDKIFRLLDLEEEQDGTGYLDIAPHSIKLNNVYFSYEEDREILKGISIDINKGSFVALVGKSGCGKSTIAGIVSCRNKGYSGEVRIDDILLDDIKEEEVMKNITVIKHNSYLFKGTVRDNLRMGNENASEEEMKNALCRVNLWSFLENEDGLDTMLAENAKNLSGGQCQRLALARALLHNTPVYIFDEATSNIDAESEEMIMQVIKELARTKTVLLISHRLMNVVDADCIYMLDNGIVKEYGTHDELMKNNGEYKRFFESQRCLEEFSKTGREEEK